MTLMGFLVPLLVAMTIVGNILYRRMRVTEPDCVSLFLDSDSNYLTNIIDYLTQYPDDASPWSLVLCLSIGWFLTYIYFLLACTVAYKRLQTTRFRYFFSIFTHMSRNDPVILRLRQLDEEDPENDAGDL